MRINIYMSPKTERKINVMEKINDFICWILDGNDEDTGIKTITRILISIFVIPICLLCYGIAWLIGFRNCRKCGKTILPLAKRTRKSNYAPSYGSWIGGELIYWYECIDCTSKEGS